MGVEDEQRRAGARLMDQGVNVFGLRQVEALIVKPAEPGPVRCELADAAHVFRERILLRDHDDGAALEG